MNKELLLIVFMFIGLAGTLIPLLPGLPLIFISLLVYSIADGWGHFSVLVISLIGIITLISVLLDYLAAFWGAKKYGASRLGITVGVTGGIVGLFVIGPVGLIMGSIVGVVLGEMLSGKGFGKSLTISFGNIIGIIASNLIQFVIGLIVFLWTIATIL